MPKKPEAERIRHREYVKKLYVTFGWTSTQIAQQLHYRHQSAVCSLLFRTGIACHRGGRRRWYPAPKVCEMCKTPYTRLMEDGSYRNPSDFRISKYCSNACRIDAEFKGRAECRQLSNATLKECNEREGEPALTAGRKNKRRVIEDV